ncbi:MAG: hypothetical protein ACPGWM_10455, partial [Flavobacteriales bacterium]
DADCSSLELIDPSFDSSLPASWQGSFVFGGTPGAGNSSAKECADCGEVGTLTDFFLNDDFETDGLSIWTATADWDTTSTLALAGSFALAHEGTTAGTSSISTPLECLQLDAACTTWNFELQTFDWVPGAGNDFTAYLAADQNDFTALDLNAMAIRINASDEIEFVSIESGTPSVLLNTGLVWTNFMSLGVEVIYAESDVWYFKMDIDGGIDNTFIFGTDISYVPNFELLHFGFEFDHALDAAGLLVIDNVAIKQCGLPETYYSVASGNVSDAIWNTDTNALVGEDVEFTKFKTMNIRNAANVVVDGDLQLSTLVVEDTNGAGTLSFSASELVQLHNNLSVTGGTLTPGMSTFLFKGASAQSIDGTSVELNNVELNNSNGLSLLDNMSLNGQLVLTAGTFATGANTLTLTS